MQAGDNVATTSRKRKASCTDADATGDEERLHVSNVPAANLVAIDSVIITSTICTYDTDLEMMEFKPEFHPESLA